jgi:hypothetical protein
MIIMYPDCIASISALSADPDYPVSNMLDDHPQKSWKTVADFGPPAPVSSSITVVTDGSAAAGIALFNTNVTSGTVLVKNSTGATTYETHSISGTYGRFFVQFNSEYEEILSIVISLTAPTTLYVGECRCGAFITIPNPKMSGLKFNRDDYSIKHELSNGGRYIFKRNTPRSFDLSFTMLQSEFETIDALFDENGSHPLAMLIGEGLSADNKWSGFFHIDEPPSADYGYPSHTDCSMTIKEAL